MASANKVIRTDVKCSDKGDGLGRSNRDSTSPELSATFESIQLNRAHGPTLVDVRVGSSTRN